MSKANLKFRMTDDDKGAMGIGVLIIFVAMVLVAAIAAGVIIQIAIHLQQQAQQTGTEALNDISTSIRVIGITGDRVDPNSPRALMDPTNESNWEQSIQVLELDLRLASGSPPVDLDQVLIEVTDGYIETNLVFNDSFSNEPNASNAGATWFTAKELFDPEGSYDVQSGGNNFLTPGALIKVYINANEIGLDLTTYKSVTVRLIPKHGIPIYENFYTPGGYSSRYIEIF